MNTQLPCALGGHAGNRALRQVRKDRSSGPLPAGPGISLLGLRTNKILQEFRPQEGLGPAGTMCPGLHPGFPGAAAGGHGWDQTSLAVWPWASRGPSLCLQWSIYLLILPVPSPGPGLGAGTSQIPATRYAQSRGRERWPARWADASGSFVCSAMRAQGSPKTARGQARPWACPGLDKTSG